MNQVEQLIEENFCLKLELDTLAEVVLRSQSERWVPGYLHTSTEHSHVERYKLACQYSCGKRVIDIACGVGKGSFMLASQGNATTVNAYDLDKDAVRYAKWRNKLQNIDFGVRNAEELDSVKQFDLAISFETIEHLSNVIAFLKNIHKSLDDKGVFIVSTPIASVPLNSKPNNPYHVQEWGFSSFHRLLQPYFDIEEVYVQLYPYHPVQVVKSEDEINVAFRAINKLKRIMVSRKIQSTSEKVKPILSNYPEIEKYIGQYNESELGSPRSGYQIVIARKK